MDPNLDFDAARRDRFAHWLSDVVEEARWHDPHHLHVEQLDARWNEPATWMDAMFTMLALAIEIRAEQAWDVAIGVGTHLTSGAARSGLDFANLSEIPERFTYIPPFVILAASGRESWKEGSYLELPPPYHAPVPFATRTFLCEWFHEDEKEFVRVLWFVAEPDQNKRPRRK